MSLIEVHIKNFGCVQKAKLALVDQGLVFIQGRNLDTEAADSNGSGKTTLFKAVSWGLYGRTIDGDSGDEVIRRGEKEASVRTFLTDASGAEWCSERTRRKGKPGLVLRDSSGKEVDAPKENLQARIIEMVGLDFEAFRNTILYGQNDSYRFADPRTKDSERKSMLHRLLSTDVLAECHRRALDRRLALKGKNNEALAEIARAEAKLEEYNVAELERQAAEWEDDREVRIQAEKNAAREAIDDGKSLSLDTGEDRRRALSKKLTAADHAKMSCDAAGEKARDLDRQIETARCEKGNLGTKVAEYNAEIATRDEALAKLDGKDCPLCSSPLGEGSPAFDRIDELKTERCSLMGEREIAFLAQEEFGTRIENLKEEAETQRARADRRGKHETSIREIADELAEMNRIDDSLKELRRRAKEAIARARTIGAEQNPRQEQVEAAKEKVDELRSAIDKQQTARGDLEDQLAHTEFWVRGYSDQGLPSFVLDSVMPYLTDRANHYLGTLADGDIQMIFSTQRELKSKRGEVRDEIDIRWTIEGFDDVTPSGAQRKKMEIATDFALMDLAASRNGRLDLMMLDEVLDGLDAAGRERVMQVLRELAAKHGSVFVISHEEGLAELFDRAFVMVKRGGVADLMEVA